MASAGSGYSLEGMSRAGSAASGHGREGISRSGSAASGHGRETMSRPGSAASGLGREGLSRAGSGGGDEAELDDAAQLTPLCEEALLRLLEARLANDQIYTWAGTALLSVNPARPLPLYAPQLARRYLQGARRTPHLYSVAATAYRWARDLGKDQCIVFTGETGSGKSECVRICVQLAVLAGGEGAGAEGGAGARLAAAGTLLETCSHAASNTHHNASRAGQKLEIDIDFKGDIVGTRVTQFLLNTECMVSRQGRERNFHAFYQLLAGADAALLKRLKLTRWWRGYVTLVAADDAGDEDDDADDARATHDANMYAHTQAAAVTLGREDWWAGVQKILAFLLKLGNVQLERTARVNAPQTYVVVNYQELEEACSLVGIEAGALGAYLGSFGSSWQRGVSALSRAIYRRVHAAACTATHAEGRHATLTLLELPGESTGTSGALGGAGGGAGGVDALLSHYVRTRLSSALRQACVCACLTADSLPSVTHAGLEQMLDAISSRAGSLPARMFEAGDMLERDREMLESRMVDLFADAGEPVFRDLFSDKNAYSPVVPAVRALASSLAARAGGARVVCCVRRAALRHAHTRAASRLLELVSLHGCGWAECFTTEEFIQRYCCLIPRDQPRRCGGAGGGACAGAGCGEGCAVRRAARVARLPLGKVAVEDDRVFIKTTALVWQLEEFRLRRVRACVRLLQRGVRAWRLRRRRRAVAVISTWWLSVARASYLLGLAARLDARHLSPLCRAWPAPPRAARTLLAEPAALLRALHHRWRCLLYRRALPQTHRNRFREKVTASALFLGRKASYPASVGSWFAGDYIRLRAAGAWRRGAGARQVLVFADACAAVGASGAARRVLLALTTAALLLLSPRSLRPRRTVSCSRLAALAVSPYHDDLLCVVLDDGASSDETEACSGASGRCDMLLRVRRLVEACSKLVLVAQHLAALPPRVAVAPAFVCRCPRATHVTVHCAATPESRIVRRGDTLHVLPPD